MKPLLLGVQLVFVYSSYCGFFEQYDFAIKHFLFWGALGIAATCYNHLKQQKKIETKDIIDPENTIIVFDLHNVIVTLDYIEMMKTLYQKPGCLLSLLLVTKPSFVKDIYKLFKTSRVAEQYVTILSQKYSLINSHFDTYIELSNAQKPIEKTCKIVHQLKQKNHRLFIFSNIGHKTFEQLTEKYPDIFDYFEEAQVSSQESGWIQKPHSDSFYSFLNRFNIAANQMLFVDDNNDNIKMAQKLGIHTIHYKSGKQLKAELKALQLL